LGKDTSLTENELTLAADFADAGHDQWLKLVDKVLGGAPFDKKLVSHTYDGIAVQPLYTRDDWRAEDESSGLPGGAPFTRGGDVLGTSVDGWDIRQSHGHPDPATANKQILEDLERGVTSIALKIDPSGLNGVAIQSLADLEATLEGVYLDLAPIALEPVALHLPVASLLVKVLEKRGVFPDKFSGNFGIDGFSSLAARGRLTADLGTGLARMADVASYVALNYPNARAFNVQSVVYHSAGAADAQELGCAIATATEYLRAMTRAGLDINAASAQIAFTVAADADFFFTIAKVRALRKLWGRVTETCGADVECRAAPITACTAPRMMSRRDPWVNILRTTVACFAAGIGGAEAVTALPFDASLGLPSDLARRIARNTQIALQEEAGLNRTIDPAGGAWMFERLSEELAEKSWAFFQKIEKQDGMANALTSGFVASEIAAVQIERMKNIHRRKDPITGVSEFPNIHEKPPNTSQRPATPSVRPNRSVGKLPEPSDGALTKALAAAAGEGANIAAMHDALLSKGGISITPLPNLRLAQDFEHLRDLGDTFQREFGHRPKLFLANMGRVFEFTARASFAKNIFEAGGIEAMPGSGGTDVATIAQEFKDSSASFAVICSSDAVYVESGALLATALKDVGAKIIYLAGRPGDQEAALKDAGVDGFVFIGCDAHAILASAHSRLKAGE
jgi:methylmalonyl-CoA mutase